MSPLRNVFIAPFPCAHIANFVRSQEAHHTLRNASHDSLASFLRDAFEAVLVNEHGAEDITN